jgi:hypothetical protein
VAHHAVRVEWDNPDSRGLELDEVIKVHDLAWSAGLRTIAKNPLLVSDPARYMSHPSIDLVIVEHAAGGSDKMDVLRREIGQPLLAVRFMAFRHRYEDGTVEDGEQWVLNIAANIREKGYKNMGVTFSPHGEYTSSDDLVVPID